MIEYIELAAKFISIRKIKKNIPIEFQLDLKEYQNNQDSNNKLIERIFNDKTIDELYLYKIKKEPEQVPLIMLNVNIFSLMIRRLYLALHYNMCHALHLQIR